MHPTSSLAPLACPPTRACSVMRESSWREQEAQDRRLASLEEERARLAFAAQAARREAALQRRQVARLQAAAAEAQGRGGAGGDGAGPSEQMVELLQKRVRVLEAQNIKLRLQARASKEEEQLEAAEAAAGAAPAGRAQRGAGGQQGAGAEAAGAAAKNEPPNGAVGGGGGGGGGAGSLLDGNPVLERWAADKRLQKRVEALQAKLRVWRE